MDKIQLQKKFRFYFVLATALLFITICLPAYCKYGHMDGTVPKRIIMMWTIIFGASSNPQVRTNFDFSWIGFIPYVIAIILLFIALARKFLTVEANDKHNKNGAAVLDVINLICSIACLILFIVLPITLTSMTTSNAAKYWVQSSYGWCVAYIFCYLITLSMCITSFVVVYADSILKFVKIKGSNNNKNKEAEKKEVKEIVEENKTTEDVTEEVLNDNEEVKND